MDTELKRFLHDQRRLKRGLPPAQWTPLKQPVPKPVNSTPRSASVSKAPLTRVQKKLARDRQRTATHLARQGIEYQVRPSPLDPK